MAYMLGIYLHANSFESAANSLWVHVVDAPGDPVTTYEVPIPHVSRHQDDADDVWLKDLLVAALEAL